MTEGWSGIVEMHLRYMLENRQHMPTDWDLAAWIPGSADV